MAGRRHPSLAAWLAITQALAVCVCVCVCGAAGIARAHVHLMKHRFRKIYDTRCDSEHEWWHVSRREGGSWPSLLVATSCCSKPLRGSTISTMRNEPNSNIAG